MARVYEAVVRPCSGGFGEYEVEVGGPSLVENAESIGDWLALCAVDVAPAPEIDGRTHNQTGGKPYKSVDGDYTTYYMVWEED